MKNVLTFLVFAFFAISAPLSIQAQKALGCNGLRYINDGFNDTTRKTVQYGSNINALNEKQDLFLDIIEPKGDTQSRRPVIIFAFGGGFVAGQRSDMHYFSQLFAKKGYVCMSIDYRLWNETKQGKADSAKIVPVVVQATQDMKAAIRYVRKSAKEGNLYRLDTNNIIIGGVSAGAIASMSAAHMDSTDNIPTFLRDVIKNQGGFEGNSGNPGFSSKVKAVINLSGGLYRADWIDSKNPPFISYHGTADNVVPYDSGLNVYQFTSQGSAACHRQALKVGVYSQLYTVQGGGHSEIYGPAYFFDLLTFLGQSTTWGEKAVCGVLSANDEILDKKLKIYPNPAYETMNFDLETEGSTYQIQIYDLVGRQVFNSGKQTTPNFTVRKQDIGRGLFIAKIKFDDAKNFVTRKVIFE